MDSQERPVARPTRRPRFSGTSPMRSGPHSDAVDLVEGPDGVWVVPETPGRLVLDPVTVPRPAAAMVRGADEAVSRSLVLTNGPANGCAVCGRKATARVRFAFVEVKVCRGCKALGSKLFDLLK